jgi:GDPmannose 4,6-dehydratase
MWLMLQQDEPDDYVLATGKRHSVRSFVEKAFAETGVKIAWRGEGLNEKGIETGTNRVLVQIDPRYFRPTEVDVLQGDSSKARNKLGWTHKTDLAALCAEMVREDLASVAKEKRRNVE